MPVSWTPRDAPLSASAAAAWGEPARALGARLLGLDDTSLARLRGAAGPRVLVVLGDAADLPWADGVVYLGADADAPALLLPTNVRPSAGAALLARALERRFPAAAPPIAVLPGPGQLVSCAAASPIARGRVARWLAEAP
ncbi:hypothetical protein [Sorangium cellulosum]|uniref:bpX5 domain-containing protein n=1 Tax=Sorangium cellulosum TaxID=56 RepID=UPI0023DDB3D3|nr:hypothetical protein [Sorangium cellulosum]